MLVGSSSFVLTFLVEDKNTVLPLPEVAAVLDIICSVEAIDTIGLAEEDDVVMVVADEEDIGIAVVTEDIELDVIDELELIDGMVVEVTTEVILLGNVGVVCFALTEPRACSCCDGGKARQLVIGSTSHTIVRIVFIFLSLSRKFSFYEFALCLLFLKFLFYLPLFTVHSFVFFLVTVTLVLSALLDVSSNNDTNIPENTILLGCYRQL